MADYTPSGDVLHKFHVSDSFVRVLLGPLGSGKTTACCYEIMRRSLEQQPFEGVRKTRWLACRNCFDDETEILTERGWLLFKDLSDDDRVAQLNGDNLEFVLPIGKYRHAYNGEMIGYESEGVDFCVTPDHWMWVSECKTRKQTWSDYSHIKAQDLYGRGRVRVRRDAQWQGVDTGRSVAFFRLLGLWFAEGSAFHGKSSDGYFRSRAVITQSSKCRLDDVEKIISESGIEFSKNKRDDESFNFIMKVNDETKVLIEELASFGKSKVKFVPDWIKNAPSEHIRAFIDGFVVGDGWRVRGSTFASTASKRLADDLQEMALRAGMVANVSVRERGDCDVVIKGRYVTTVKDVKEYVLTFLTKGKHKPRLRNKLDSKIKRGWYKKNYEGEVYCVEVPTHIVYVRRRGKAFWCGQTVPELETTTIPSWTQHFGTSFGSWNKTSPITHRLRFKLGDGTMVEADVYFLGLDGPDASNRIRGMELTGAWVNEMKDVGRGIVDMLTGRIGRYPSRAMGGPTWFGIIGDTNMPDDDHYLYDMCEKTHPEGWEFFRQPGGVIKVDDKWIPNSLAENIVNLPKDYYKNQLAGKGEPWIKVFLASEWGYVSEGRAVYPEYSDVYHVIEIDHIPGEDIFIGMDLGLTPAAVFVQKDAWGRWIVVDELIAFDIGTMKFTRELKRFIARRFPGCKIGGFWGDPVGAKRASADENERTTFQIMGAQGVKVTPAPGNNELMIRREAVAGALVRFVDGKPGLLISKACTKLRAGMAGKYCFKRIQLRTDSFSDTPVKNEYSHVSEALQYVMLGLGEADGIIRNKNMKTKSTKVVTGTKNSRHSVRRKAVSKTGRSTNYYTEKIR